MVDILSLIDYINRLIDTLVYLVADLLLVSFKKYVVVDEETLLAV